MLERRGYEFGRVRLSDSSSVRLLGFGSRLRFRGPVGRLRLFAFHFLRLGRFEVVAGRWCGQDIARRLANLHGPFLLFRGGLSGELELQRGRRPLFLRGRESLRQVLGLGPTFG